MSEPLLSVVKLRTEFHTDEGIIKAVDDITFDIAPGETLGLVGESGSGKSVTSLTIMRLLPEAAARVAQGTVSFLGRDLATATSRQMNELRGRDLAMIFQEPMTSLNPVFRVGEQVAESLIVHEGMSKKQARARTIALFREVGIPDPESRIDSYPHEMSGGQKQRVMIAMALACNPKLLIADEPTTALDVTIQAQILALLRELRDKRGMSMLFITHDLGVIAEIADNVAVMYRGKLVEYGPVLDVFGSPKHPYTRGLLHCRPRLDTPYTILPTVQDFMESRIEGGELVIDEKPMTEERLAVLTATGRGKQTDPQGEPMLVVEHLSVHFAQRTGFLSPKKVLKAVDDVSFSVWPGQTLGLVGESGCGKTTAGRAILRLIEPTAGEVRFQGTDLRALGGGALRAMRRHMQIIFQDPYSSLNPRMSVGDALTEPMMVHGLGGSAAERRDRAASLLEEVGLLPIHLRRYPHEFSGGQRQRICIARALSLEPKFIICDESVSALDVSVQAQVLNLLKELQTRRNLTYIFISHDLAVVKFMSDTMAVMQAGRIVEIGHAEAIYADPQQEYTRRLIAAIPRDDIAHIRAIRAARGRSTPAPAPTVQRGIVFHALDAEDQPAAHPDVPHLVERGLTPEDRDRLLLRLSALTLPAPAGLVETELRRLSTDAATAPESRVAAERVLAWVKTQDRPVLLIAEEGHAS